MMAAMASASILLVILLGAALLFLFSALLQWLWNLTMPEVFGLKEIQFWQAFRLLLIAAILFGGPNINMGN